MKVMIGVPTQEFARRADFYDRLNFLEKPEGTLAAFSHSQSPAKNRNIIIQQALDNDCTHVFFIDDDVLVRPDTLISLLKHDVDMVSGLYLMRSYPHKPIIFDYTNEKGEAAWHYLQPGEKGLIEVVAAGLGCALIKTDVFRKMGGPFWVTLGELEPDGWCDDLAFFARARKAGFKLFCDLDCPVGHIASVAIWPREHEGNWYLTYDTNGESQITIPMQGGPKYGDQ